jgi:spore coat protein U-like protein
MLRRFSLASALLVAGSIVASVAPAIAATATSDITVSADVAADCTISTSALSFGSYYQISSHASSPLDATGTVTTTCTTGSGPKITLGQGSNPAGTSTDAAPLRRLNDGGTNYLSYSLYQDSGHTTVWGNTAGTAASPTADGTAQITTIYGRVAGAQAPVPAGTYTDTVTATVTF